MIFYRGWAIKKNEAVRISNHTKTGVMRIKVETDKDNAVERMKGEIDRIIAEEEKGDI